MLVGDTIRLSIYTRRREVEVMRLVGATRWFIRWPFMLEGMVVGFVGGRTDLQPVHGGSEAANSVTVEQEVRQETAQLIKDIEQRAKEEADKRARELLRLRSSDALPTM